MGATSRRARTVSRMPPGVGRPSSMCSVPPFASTRLKLWLPPKVWCQGSQSTITGGSAVSAGKRAWSIAWLELSIRWVFTTAFGTPVEPEVNRSFATVSGTTAAWAAATASGPSAARRSANGVAGRPIAAPSPITTSVPAGTAAAMAAA